MDAIALATVGYISNSFARAATAAGPVAPDHAQNLLVKSLMLPLPKSMTEALGIHQSDVIIRYAIEAGLADLRANPWLLDYAFKSLAADSLTAEQYGEFEIAQAKKWFLHTNVRVIMSDTLDAPDFPCVSIALRESVESAATLGDVHYVPQEETEADWPILAGPIVPSAYNAATGILSFKPEDLEGLILSPGMVVIDRVGRTHNICEVIDDGVVALTPGTVADFNRALIKGCRPRFLTQLESLEFRETYAVGCHVKGETVHLTYLYSVVMFVMLRYKQALLEARGFERSTVSAGEHGRNQFFENEVVYTRTISTTGYVRNYWPKAMSERIEVVAGKLVVGKATSGDTVSDGGQMDAEWFAEQDALTVKMTK